MGDRMGIEKLGSGVRGGADGRSDGGSKKKGGGAEMESMDEEKGRESRVNDMGKEKDAGQGWGEGEAARKGHAKGEGSEEGGNGRSDEEKESETGLRTKEGG